MLQGLRKRLLGEDLTPEGDLETMREYIARTRYGTKERSDANRFAEGLASVTDFKSAFKNCPELAQFPEGLFDTTLPQGYRGPQRP
jgi:hypothetical protein